MFDGGGELRSILHVDLNAFYASVEQALDPSLRGMPLAVAGEKEKRNGIILTSSYEARSKGVKTAMTIGEALKKCPELVLVKPNLPAYLDYSNCVMGILRSFSPDMEIFSIDEAWLDVTGCVRLFGSPDMIADKIRENIKSRLGITASVGVSYCKLIAKMASEFKKPDGTSVVLSGEIHDKIWPLPVGSLIGVGGMMKVKLNDMGIYYIGDLACTQIGVLSKKFGKIGTYLWYFANGIDNSPVNPDPYEVKGVGNSVTTPGDIKNLTEACEVLMALSENVGKRLREQGLEGNIIEITVKTKDFVTFQRRRKLEHYTSVTNEIYSQAVMLLMDNCDFSVPVRLLGVRVGGTCGRDQNCQISFFEQTDRLKNQKIDECVDSIRKKYGYESLTRGSLIVDQTKNIVISDSSFR